jgi:2-iminobutanoate/2-iminopropanoate deaminase
MGVELHNPRDIIESPVLSYATQIGDAIFTSGLVPRDPATGDIIEGNIDVQTTAVFENLRRILASVHASEADVAKVTVYLTDLGDAAGMTEVYQRFFGSHKPARTTIEISGLTPGMRIEVEAVIAAPKP